MTMKKSELEAMPAFPKPGSTNGYPNAGVSLREYYIGQVLAGALATSGRETRPAPELARKAVSVADATIELLALEEEAEQDSDPVRIDPTRIDPNGEDLAKSVRNRFFIQRAVMLWVAESPDRLRRLDHEHETLQKIITDDLAGLMHKVICKKVGVESIPAAEVGGDLAQIGAIVVRQILDDARKVCTEAGIHE